MARSIIPDQVCAHMFPKMTEDRRLLGYAEYLVLLKRMRFLTVYCDLQCFQANPNLPIYIESR